MRIVIREVVSADAPALVDYVTRLFSEDLPGIWERPVPTLEEEREFIAGYAAANSALVVAECEGTIVGLAGLRGGWLAQQSHVGSLAISVGREWRGRGIGTALLEHLIAWAQKRGITRLEIEAFSTNPRAIALYERLGFEREGVRRAAAMVDGESVDVVCLARLLDTQGED